MKFHLTISYVISQSQVEMRSSQMTDLLDLFPSMRRQLDIWWLPNFGDSIMLHVTVKAKHILKFMPGYHRLKLKNYIRSSDKSCKNLTCHLTCKKENWVGNFIFRVLCQDFFDIRDIFNIFFGPSIARVKKCVENVEKLFEGWNLRDEISSNTRNNFKV